MLSSLAIYHFLWSHLMEFGVGWSSSSKNIWYGNKIKLKQHVVETCMNQSCLKELYIERNLLSRRFLWGPYKVLNRLSENKFWYYNLQKERGFVSGSLSQNNSADSNIVGWMVFLWLTYFMCPGAGWYSRFMCLLFNCDDAYFLGIQIL